ncbi:MAG: hypothetical protein QG617_1767 [Campylobacterota bacterium]|nr:hypothetical protein [Campylobacterota bacterium]
MNKIIAKVTNIKNIDSLNIVEFDSKGQKLTMMSLELFGNIKPLSKVILTCKASSIGVAKNLSGELSYSNRLDCTLESVQTGELLCTLSLKISEDTTLESIITKASVDRMNLRLGDKLEALIKASDLSIYKIVE